MTPLHKILPLVEPSKAVKHPLLNPPTLPGPPVNMYPPQVYGVAGLGNVLYGSPGRWWGGTALTLSLQWQQDGVDIPGETGPWFAFMAPDEYLDIRLKVTATDTNNQSTVSSSDPITFTNLVQLADAQALFTAVNVTSLGLNTTDGVIEGPNTDFVTQTVNRLLPKFFTVTGPQSMSFALTTTGTNLRVDWESRMESDLCGLVFTSVDSKEHVSLAYQTKKDYRNMIWQFDLALDAQAPLINDVSRPLMMTVDGRNAGGSPVSYSIALKNYASVPNSRSSHVTINFDTVMAGLNADVATYMGDVDRITISCITIDYVAGSPNSISRGPVKSWITLSNCAVSGTNSTMTAGSGQILRHQLGMCTSYDDMYDVSPERILDNIWGLGYRDWINHYVGMSVFPERHWDGTKLTVNDPGSAAGLVSTPAKTWHTDFLTKARAKGYAVIQAVSFETTSVSANTAWCQRDYLGNLGQTSYAVPAYLLSPGNATAVSWLNNVFLEFALVASNSGVPIYMQVSEPGWWVTTANKPCFYDAATTAAFTAQYSLIAPDMGITSTIINPGTPYDQWKSFLSDTLGKTVSGIRQFVQKVLPNAQFSVLPFLSTIIGRGYMETINLPNTYYHAPNFDFFQTEAYDWILSNDQADLPKTMTYPMTTLGYDAHKVQYLAGYSPLAPSIPGQPSESVWTSIFQNVNQNETYHIAKQYIWAYPQVMRDSITYKEGAPTARSFTFGAGASFHQIAT